MSSSPLLNDCDTPVHDLCLNVPDDYQSYNLLEHDLGGKVQKITPTSDLQKRRGGAWSSASTEGEACSTEEAVCRLGPRKLSARLRQLAGFDVFGQVFPPFLVAGAGMVAAGLLLSDVRRWTVFEDVRPLMILVPALLGLKGNLEMTLASRLATHANLGDLDEGDTLVSIVLGNLALVQCQAITVGFLAALVAGAMSLLEQEEVTVQLVLSSIMILLVLVAYRAGLDPDNIASPIAGMLGDCCTLGLLAFIASIFWDTRTDWKELQVWVLLLYCLAVPFFARVANNCKHTSVILRSGWTPIIVSMFISSLGGLILKHSVKSFHGLSRFAPVMNGAGGNLAAVHASRISTELHATSRLGAVLPSGEASRDNTSVGNHSVWSGRFVSELCPSLLGPGAHAR
eukprot:CAMPEP_0115163396 /NCGR_PEP_ID=MMETSP0227-20121206/72488_1 /TAXON_ID=89957 /ORGANISM="Polarella glacialis, Strain CCMP 1383" /LENGTH=398 /DNA_ID=CAMNT_0002575701 /DNA_START=48 /DNA_END=1240 /DNA_ORIENTATION=+